MITAKNLHQPDVAQWLLRIGLAFVFLYAGISSLQHPVEWIGYLPSFVVQHLDADLCIKVFGAAELVLAVWLLSGKFVRYAAGLAALLLVGVVLANPANLIITFRDVGLVFAALALFFVA